MLISSVKDQQSNSLRKKHCKVLSYHRLHRNIHSVDETSRDISHPYAHAYHLPSLNIFNQKESISGSGQHTLDDISDRAESRSVFTVQAAVLPLSPQAMWLIWSHQYCASVYWLLHLCWYFLVSFIITSTVCDWGAAPSHDSQTNGREASL